LKICLEPDDEIWLPEFTGKVEGRSPKMYAGVETLVQVEGNIDAQKYTKILSVKHFLEDLLLS